jgi:hypothetical protein
MLCWPLCRVGIESIVMGTGWRTPIHFQYIRSWSGGLTPHPSYNLMAFIQSYILYCIHNDTSFKSPGNSIWLVRHNSYRAKHSILFTLLAVPIDVSQHRLLFGFFLLNTDRVPFELLDSAALL